MASVETKYMSGHREEKKYDTVQEAIEVVRNIFRGSAVSNMPGGFVTLKDGEKQQVFQCDGGTSFKNWDVVNNKWLREQPQETQDSYHKFYGSSADFTNPDMLRGGFGIDPSAQDLSKL